MVNNLAANQFLAAVVSGVKTFGCMQLYLADGDS